MRWRHLRRSSNVEDARNADSRAGGMPGGGMRAGLPIGGKMGGIGFIVVLAIAYFVGGPDALISVLSGGGGGMTQAPGAAMPGQVEDAGTPAASTAGPPTDDAGAFIAAMLGSTEDVWTQLLASQGQRYEAPTLKLFREGTNSGCGFNTAAVGPFYCPPDRKVYIDLSFYDQLAQMGGAGDFAQAYVVGHEVGHHLQNLMGTAARVHALRQRVSEAEANQLQVRMELQADCYAGVWAHHANRAQQVLEPGDVEEGMEAARAIGDDTLQRNAGRQVSPDSFTHGSSAQRMQWLRRGLETGSIEACDTFAAG